jgi:LysM repeat protein
MASTLEAQGNPELFTENRNGGDGAALKALDEVQKVDTKLQPNLAADSTAAKSLPGVTLVDGAAEGVAIKGEVTVQKDQTLSHIAKENLPPGASSRDIYNYVNQIAKLNDINKDKITDTQKLILPEYVDPRAPKPEAAKEVTPATPEGKQATDVAPTNPEGKQATDVTPANTEGKQATDVAPANTEATPEAAAVDNAAKAAEMTKAYPNGAALLEALGHSADGSFSRQEIDAAVTALSPYRFAPENPTFDQVTALSDLQEAIKTSPRQVFSAADYDNLIAGMSAPPAAEPALEPTQDTGRDVTPSSPQVTSV